MNNHEKIPEDPYMIAKYMKESKKTTPIKVYLKGTLSNIDFSNFKEFGNENFKILFGEWEDFKPILENHKEDIVDYHIENDRRNSAFPLLDMKNVSARIEPGAIIRETAKIGYKSIIMMGAIINVGVEIGDYTMIDMNAVIGSRAKIGKNVHIGAGAVLAGVLEPPSKSPVIVEDDVLVGANAVILEGIKIGRGAVIAAGSVVTKNVPANSVVAGIPAKFIKEKDNITSDKTSILKDIRE